MLTEIHQPRHLSPAMLDTYLEQGWFRMGQMIFTCYFLCFQHTLYSAVWTRLPLKGHAFGKRQRKLLRSNEKRFRTLIRPAIFDDEKEILYQKHRQRFEGFVAHNLRDSLFGDSTHNIYDTYEVSVFDGDQLIAVSFFDMGAESLASIMGLFDPEYARFSLGIYTMLVEVMFGMQKGKQFYYPGYIVPGYDKFEYKRRVGALEYFDIWQRHWAAYPLLDRSQLPAEQLTKALKKVQSKLLVNNVQADITLYPLYDKQLFGLEEGESVRSPLILSVYHHPIWAEWQIVEYDLIRKEYVLSEVIKVEDAFSLVHKLFEDYKLERSCLNFLVKEKQITRTTSANQIAQAVKSRYLQQAPQY